MVLLHPLHIDVIADRNEQVPISMAIENEALEQECCLQQLRMVTAKIK